jgi:hypothetical protein
MVYGLPVQTPWPATVKKKALTTKRARDTVGVICAERVRDMPREEETQREWAPAVDLVSVI